jgi:hypothetical protein
MSKGDESRDRSVSAEVDDARPSKNVYDYIDSQQDKIFASANDPLPGGLVVGESMAEALIQWKGTDVCLDFHCKCGKHLHFDEMFLYAVQCGHCQRLYAMGNRVCVIDVTGTEYEDAVVSMRPHVGRDAEDDQ